MSITAIVENDTIKLPVHVPDGTRVEIVLPGESDGSAQRPWMELAGCLAGEADELRRVDRLVEAEFESVNPDDWR